MHVAAAAVARIGGGRCFAAVGAARVAVRIARLAAGCARAARAIVAGGGVVGPHDAASAAIRLVPAQVGFTTVVRVAIAALEIALTASWNASAARAAVDGVVVLARRAARSTIVRARARVDLAAIAVALVAVGVAGSAFVELAATGDAFAAG